jgi:molybdenum cofactor cytidylyltransferase
MSRSPSFCGVVLAAGESSRMGRDKALLPWPPVTAGVTPSGTFLSGQIGVLRHHSDMVLVVAGKNIDRLRPVVYSLGAFVVENPDPGRGQFSSLRVGLQEVLNRGRDAALVALVDRPPVQDATVALLRETFLDSIAKGAWAVVPEHEGKHGHPIVIGREMIGAFLSARDATNARDVEHQHHQHIVYVPVDDPFIAINVDTPEDYERLQPSELRSKH